MSGKHRGTKRNQRRKKKLLKNRTVGEQQQLSDEHLKRLADEGNLVYQYETVEQDPSVGAESAEEYKNLVKEIRGYYLQLREVHPTWSDDGCRREIIKTRKSWQRFSRRHSQNNSNVFMKITNRQTGVRDMEAIFHFLFIRQQMESGLISEEQAKGLVQAFAINKSS